MNINQAECFKYYFFKCTITSTFQIFFFFQTSIPINIQFKYYVFHKYITTFIFYFLLLLGKIKQPIFTTKGWKQHGWKEARWGQKDVGPTGVHEAGGLIEAKTGQIPKPVCPARFTMHSVFFPSLRMHIPLLCHFSPQ